LKWLLERDRKINELEERLDLKAKLTWEKPYYWIVDRDKKDGPFYQQCYDTDGKLIRLQGSGDAI
jgi:hypothetical protein